MKREKGVVKLYMMEGMGFLMLVSMGILFLGVMILAGTPCWFIERLIARKRLKKLIAEGGTPPPPPSRQRRIVEGGISIFMSAIWFALVIFLITRFTYPFCADTPLPYRELWSDASGYELSNPPGSPWSNSKIAICPLKKDNFTTRELAATCNAAARYYYGEFGHKLTVEVSVCPEETRPDSFFNAPGNSRGSQSRTLGAIYPYCEVARCGYAPEKDKQWDFFQVAVNADNVQPLINSLWVENEYKFASESEREARANLKKLVSSELNLPPAAAEPREFNLKSAPEWILPDIPPAAPVD